MRVVVPLPAETEHEHTLRVMGLRWDPGHEQWKGRMCGFRVEALRKALGPEVSVQTS